MRLETLFKRPWTVGAALSVVLLAYAVVFEIPPRAGAVLRQAHAWKASRVRLASGKGWKGERKQLLRRRRVLQEKLGALFVNLPASDRMSVVLSALQNEARAAEVSLLEVRPLEEKRRDAHDELPVQVVVRARYHNFGRFVSRLERSKYLMSVDEIHLDTPEVTTPQMRASLKVSVTTLKAQGEQS